MVGGPDPVLLVSASQAPGRGGWFCWLHPQARESHVQGTWGQAALVGRVEDGDSEMPSELNLGWAPEPFEKPIEAVIKFKKQNKTNNQTSPVDIRQSIVILGPPPRTSSVL